MSAQAPPKLPAMLAPRRIPRGARGARDVPGTPSPTRRVTSTERHWTNVPRSPLTSPRRLSSPGRRRSNAEAGGPTGDTRASEHLAGRALTPPICVRRRTVAPCRCMAATKGRGEETLLPLSVSATRTRRCYLVAHDSRLPSHLPSPSHDTARHPLAMPCAASPDCPRLGAACVLPS